jgi:hypothetical protein
MAGPLQYSVERPCLCGDPLVRKCQWLYSIINPLKYTLVTVFTIKQTLQFVLRVWLWILCDSQNKQIFGSISGFGGLLSRSAS